MVDFYKDWYNNLIAHSDEKSLLVEKISDLMQQHPHAICLEIGLGTSAYFARTLSPNVHQYCIVEKEPFNEPLPENVTFTQGDFEHVSLPDKFDVILASHVVYYFQDLTKSIEKIMNHLTNEGRVYFVVNGTGKDYGLVKAAFADITHRPYTFTYNTLLSELKGYTVEEHTVQANLSFTTHEDLYEALRLSFDLFPAEYEQHKQEVVQWLIEHISGNIFRIDQKILVVSHTPNNTAQTDEWSTLLHHPTHTIQIEDMSLLIEDGVFTPDPTITNSATIILNHLPDLRQKRVADVGTGTGILAIKAALLGASEVVATDISETSIQNTRTNTQTNGVEKQIQVMQTNLLDGVDGTFDVIFANLPILDTVWTPHGVQTTSTIQNLLTSAYSKLNTDGVIYIPWGSFAESDRAALEQQILQQRYTFEVMTEERLSYTWYLYTIHK